MVLGEFATESTQYGKQEVTVKALPDRKLKDQLKEAVCHIQGNIEERELEDSELEDAAVSVPADPNVKNFSFTNIEGKSITGKFKNESGGAAESDCRACPWNDRDSEHHTEID